MLPALINTTFQGGLYMNNFAARLKDDLWDMISSMAENAWLYVTNPKSNFT